VPVSSSLLVRTVDRTAIAYSWTCVDINNTSNIALRQAASLALPMWGFAAGEEAVLRTLVECLLWSIVRHDDDGDPHDGMVSGWWMRWSR